MIRLVFFFFFFSLISFFGVFLDFWGEVLYMEKMCIICDFGEDGGWVVVNFSNGGGGDWENLYYRT